MMLRVARWPFLAIFLAFSLAPFYWTLVSSLKEGDRQLIAGNPWWPDFPPYLGNYADLITSPRFWTLLGNTVAVTGATLVLSLGASVLAAYALTGLEERRARWVLIGLFFTYALPQGVLALPLSRVLADAGLLNSPLALVLTYPSLVIPFVTWLVWTTLSREGARDLIDLAMVEGAGPLDMATKVVVPLAAPALAAACVFGVAIVFNDYLYVFTFISGESHTTLMGALGTTNVDIEDPGFRFSAMMASVAPIAFASAWFVQRYATALGASVIEI